MSPLEYSKDLERRVNFLERATKSEPLATKKSVHDIVYAMYEYEYWTEPPSPEEVISKYEKNLLSKLRAIIHTKHEKLLPFKSAF